MKNGPVGPVEVTIYGISRGRVNDGFRADGFTPKCGVMRAFAVKAQAVFRRVGAVTAVIHDGSEEAGAFASTALGATGREPPYPPFHVEPFLGFGAISPACQNRWPMPAALWSGEWATPAAWFHMWSPVVPWCRRAGRVAMFRRAWQLARQSNGRPVRAILVGQSPFLEFLGRDLAERPCLRPGGIIVYRLTVSPQTLTWGQAVQSSDIIGG